MPNLNNTTSITPPRFTFGVEIETSGIGYTPFGQKLASMGHKGFRSEYDASSRVDAEIVTAVLTPCQTAWEFLQNLCAGINAIGRQDLGNVDRLVNSGCGLHIHIGNAPLNDGVDPDEFCRNSINYMETNGTRSGTGFYTDHADPMPIDFWKDIITRYSRHQNVASTMMAESRRQNRFCSPIGGSMLTRLEAAGTNDENELKEVLRRTPMGGKFSSVTLETWGNGTVEFRQHQGTTDAVKIRKWVEFIMNALAHSYDNRFDVQDGSRLITTPTPTDPFRRNSRVGVQYNMMRVDGGATTRDIMAATGCGETRVRASVSEIRNRVGDAAVVTHTQQANGGRYGDGTDLARYEVLRETSSQASGMSLMTENRRGIDSLFAGLSDEDFEWWQDRIAELA